MADPIPVPDQQSIAALLDQAGFIRSEAIRDRGIAVAYSEGHDVTPCPFGPGLIVRWWPAPDTPTGLADTRSALVRMAEVITAGGFAARLDRHELIVTSKEDDGG